MLDIKIRAIIDKLSLSKSDRNQINQLLNLPQVQVILGADEISYIDRRKKLIKELTEITHKKDELGKIQYKEYILAEGLLKKVEKEYLEAKENFKNASLAVHYSGYNEGIRKIEIERQLMEEADPRINDFHIHLNVINEKTRHIIVGWNQFGGYDWLGKEKYKFKSNINDINVARVEIDNCITILNELRLSAVSFNEVNIVLNGLTDKLKEPLRKLNITPPFLDENNKVKSTVS